MKRYAETRDGTGLLVASEVRQGRTWLRVESAAFCGWYPSTEASILTSEFEDHTEELLADLPSRGTMLPWNPKPRYEDHEDPTIQPIHELPENLTPTNSVPTIKQYEPNAIFGSDSMLDGAGQDMLDRDESGYDTEEDPGLGTPFDTSRTAATWTQHDSGDLEFWDPHDDESPNARVRQDEQGGRGKWSGSVWQNSDDNEGTHRHDFDNPKDAHGWASQQIDSLNERNGRPPVDHSYQQNPNSRVLDEDDYSDPYYQPFTPRLVEPTGRPLRGLERYRDDAVGGGTSSPNPDSYYEESGWDPQDHTSLDSMNVKPDKEREKSPYSWLGKKIKQKRAAFSAYIALLEKDPQVRQAAWADVRRKAIRLRDEGNVHVESFDPHQCLGMVQGDHGLYDTQIHRKRAFGKGITWYDCTCEWGKWAYKRERSYVGRMCSHAYALYMEMQSLDTRNPYKKKWASDSKGCGCGCGDCTGKSGCKCCSDCKSMKKSKTADFMDMDTVTVIQPVWAAIEGEDNEQLIEPGQRLEIIGDSPDDGQTYECHMFDEPGITVWVPSDVISKMGKIADFENPPPMHQLGPDGDLEVYGDDDPMGLNPQTDVYQDMMQELPPPVQQEDQKLVLEQFADSVMGPDNGITQNDLDNVNLEGDPVPHMDEGMGTSAPDPNPAAVNQTSDIDPNEGVDITQLQHALSYLKEPNSSSNEGSSDRFDFAKSAQAHLRKTAGKDYSLSEQAALMDEPGQAEQLDDLNLENSFYL